MAISAARHAIIAESHFGTGGGLSELGRVLKAKYPAVLIVGKGFPIAGPGDDGAQGLFR
jgi:hypothetical protein